MQLCVRSNNDQAQNYLQNPYLFMCADLFDAQQDVSVPLAASECLAGTIVSSLYRLKDIDNTDGGFFIFGDISIKIEGFFRLKFNLFEISPVPSSRALTTDSQLEANYVQSVISQPFQVFAAKTFPGMSQSTFLSRSFSDQGVRIRIRKEHRIQVRQNRSGNESVSGHEIRTRQREMVSTASVAYNNRHPPPPPVLQHRSTTSSSSSNPPYEPYPSSRIRPEAPSFPPFQYPSFPHHPNLSPMHGALYDRPPRPPQEYQRQDFLRQEYSRSQEYPRQDYPRAQDVTRPPEFRPSPQAYPYPSLSRDNSLNSGNTSPVPDRYNDIERYAISRRSAGTEQELDTTLRLPPILPPSNSNNNTNTNNNDTSVLPVTAASEPMLPSDVAQREKDKLSAIPTQADF